MKLTATKVKALNSPGRYADGNGLYLQVAKQGTKSWIYRFQLNGKRRELGLGSIKEKSLSVARSEARAMRELVLQGVDPKLHRDAGKNEQQTRQSWTFDRASEAYIQSHESAWNNKKHIQQWRNTLNTYASPVLGSIPVEIIDTALVMRCIEPIWLSKNETATRVRARIEKVLSWSIALHYRDSPNPAVWRGTISELLPQPSKVSTVKHHSALPYAELPVFMDQLAEKESISAKALQFTILTCVRTSEAISASWDEIDFENAVWTIPAIKMKSNREHRVPLSSQAIALLESLPRLNGWLFPSPQYGKHLSNMAMLTLLKKHLNRPDLTVHGFRSTFRDWSAEVSDYPRELAESALAHTLGNKTEAAYQRGDYLEKRRDLMQSWSDYAQERQEKILAFRS